MTIRRQKGISLLSLMIGASIGIFLIGTMIKTYVDSRGAFKVRNAISEVVENQRFATDDMRRILFMAGRGVLGLEDNEPDRRTFPPVAGSKASAEASGAEYIYSGGATDSDVIAIRYRKGPSCGPYQDVDIHTRPSMVRFLVNGNKELVCELTTYGSGGGTTRQTLSSGVLMLKALYGVDDDGDGYPNRYLTADKVDDVNVVPIPANANTPWAKVVSIRIGMVTGSESELPASARKQQADTLKLLGMNFAEPDTSHVYKVASATVSLRNLNPVVQRQ